MTTHKSVTRLNKMNKSHKPPVWERGKPDIYRMRADRRAIAESLEAQKETKHNSHKK